jgi:hypothetical protein
MSKKLIVSIVAAVALLFTAGAQAQENRDLLLTAEGTIYTVETVVADPSDPAVPGSLRLTVQNGSSTAAASVPASINGSVNVDPALAYDATSKTLFLFWNAVRNNGLSSDLMFCSYRNGAFGEGRALDGADWNVRSGLRIGITRQSEVVGPDATSVPEITVHAVWWQESGTGEWARYAMLTTDNGNVTTVDVRDLATFTAANGTVPTRCTNELLRHPAIIESAAHNTIDVVFGDATANKLHMVTLKPTINGRLRIPIGVKDGNMPTPVVAVSANAVVSALPLGNDGLALYFANKDVLNYLLYKDGAWSPMRAIALTDKLTRDGAVDALRRMVSSE